MLHCAEFTSRCCGACDVNKGDRSFLAGAVFIVLFCAAYCLATVAALPLPRYYPIEHLWRWARLPGVISQGWYGAMVFGFAVAALPALLLHWTFGRLVRPRHLSPAWIRGLSALVLATVLSSLTFLLLRELCAAGPNLQG